MTGNTDMHLLVTETFFKNGPHNGPQGLGNLNAQKYIDIDKMQLCSLSVAYACPYHNPTATMGHTVHNADISKLLTHTTLYPWSAVVRLVRHSAKFSKMMLEAAYDREMTI